MRGGNLIFNTSCFEQSPLWHNVTSDQRCAWLCVCVCVCVFVCVMKQSVNIYGSTWWNRRRALISILKARILTFVCQLTSPVLRPSGWSSQWGRGEEEEEEGGTGEELQLSEKTGCCQVVRTASKNKAATPITPKHLLEKKGSAPSSLCIIDDDDGREPACLDAWLPARR